MQLKQNCPFTQALTVALIALVPVQAFAHEADDCLQTIHDYAITRDARDAAAFADLFTEDAVLRVLGQTYTGRDAIRARLEAPGAPTVHLVSSARIHNAADGTVSGTSYVTVYTYEPQPDGKPAAVEGFAAMGVYNDVYRRDADRCRISERTFVQRLVYADSLF